MGLRSIWTTRDAKSVETVSKSTLEKRVEKIPTHELFGWIDNSQHKMNRDFKEWHSSTQTEYLEDALLEIQAIEALIKELIARDKDE